MSESKRPLRVAYCVTSFDLGGTELNAIRTMEGIDRALVTPVAVVLRTDGVLRPRYEAARIPMLTLPLGSFASARAVRAAVRLARFLRQERVDVFHSQDVYTNIFGVPCARLARVPLVVASRRWWRATPRPGLLGANRLVCRRAHYVTANSDRVRDLVIQEDHLPPDRVVAFPNFIADRAFVAPSPRDRHAWRERYAIPAGAVVLGSVARLAPVKGLPTLLRAVAPLLARREDVWLVLVGDGPDRDSLESLAAGLGITPRVCFTGALSNDPNLHHFFDVSVLPSLSEAFPNSVVEAMAAARPVIASRVGGVPDAVEEGVSGLLVPPGDDDALADALQRLVNDPDERHRMGNAGRLRAERLYRQEVVLGRLASWYRAKLFGWTDVAA